MQTRYNDGMNGSSVKSSFNEGHCANSAKEDSIDIKKYKPISKNAGSRARLNSPDGSMNNLFEENLKSTRGSLQRGKPRQTSCCGKPPPKRSCGESSPATSVCCPKQTLSALRPSAESRGRKEARLRPRAPPETPPTG